MQAKDKICLAIDVKTKEDAQLLVSELKDYVGVYKVGKELFTSVGPEIVKTIVNNGGKVFLDLKYHDIPNTVAKAGEAATKLGVYMFNVHCSGGKAMMEAVAKSVKETAEQNSLSRPLVLGVTILTSISQEELNNELNIPGTVEEQVVRFAKLAKDAGLDGVVASPKEIKAIRAVCGDKFVIVTPGIRPVWAKKNDQQRITTPKQAIDDGASYLVIGRAITAQENKAEAAKKILDEIES